MRRTLGELDGLVRLAADLGVDRLWAQQLAHDLSDTAGRPEFDAMRDFTDQECIWGAADDVTAATAEVEEVVRAAQALAAELGVEVRLPDVGPTSGPHDQDGEWDELPCDWPWRSAYVNHDGRVQPCCMVMGDDRATMGRLDDPGGFPAVWAGPAYVAFRQALLSDEPPEVCRGCAQYRRRF